MKVSLADVKPGSYIGVSAMPQSDGTERAMHIHIFPEAMRGTGEGYRPFDLRPGSTMTNAAVDTTVVGTDGQMVTVKYKDGEKKFVVPADAPIVAYVPGTRDELKPGAKIMIFNAVKQPDGSVPGRLRSASDATGSRRRCRVQPGASAAAVPGAGREPPLALRRCPKWQSAFDVWLSGKARSCVSSCP